MIELTTKLVFLVLLWVGRSQSICRSSPTLEMPTRYLQPGEKVSVTGGVGSVSGVYYPHSAKWTFEAPVGGNLTVQIEAERFNISLQECTGIQTEPYVGIDLKPREAGFIKVCTDRVVSNPLVAYSNKLQIYHCNGISGGTFKFDVTALVAGQVIVGRNVEKRKIKSKKEIQWVNLVGTAGQGIVLELNGVNVKRGRGTGCRKGFISVKSTDSDSTSLLPSGTEIICNQLGYSHNNHYKIQTRKSSINVTFRNARFNMIYMSAPYENLPTAVSPSVKTTTITPIGPNGRLNIDPGSQDNDNTVSTDDDNPVSAGGDNSSMYRFVGVGVAGLVVVIALIVATALLVRQRKRKRQRRESMKILTQGGTSTTRDSLMYNPRLVAPGDGVSSINNQMYERVVSSERIKRSDSAKVNPRGLEEHEATEATEPVATTHLLQMTEMDKKQQRLSQLDDKYIPFEFRNSASPPRAEFAIPKQPQDDANRRRFQLRPLPESPDFPPPPVNLTDVRPPLPTPEQDNRYESVGSLTSADLVAPAYATVAEDEITDAPLRPPVINLPKGYYVSNEEIHKAEFPDDHSDEYSTPRKPKKTLQVDTPSSKGSSLNIPLVGNDGYLSLTSNENVTESMDSLETGYVAVNSASQDDIARHLRQNKAIPRPGIVGSVASSLPDLIDAPSNQPKNKAVKLRRKNLMPPGIPVKSTTALRDEREVYDKPRPSVPDIFIQCAYTSSEDVSNIRKRLQKISDEANKSNTVETNEHSRTSSPVGGSPRYDSPRPSIDGSHDSLISSPGREFYDHPRPSLPNIFPDDIKQMVNTSRLSPT